MDQTTVVPPPRKDAEVAAPQSGGDLAGQLKEVWKDTLEIADAQMSILALKITRPCVIAVFCLVATAVLIVLAFHGFFLLDACLAQALSHSTFPTWVSPLTRGILYTSLPAAVLLYLWHTRVGYGANSK